MEQTTYTGSCNITFACADCSSIGSRVCSSSSSSFSDSLPTSSSMVSVCNSSSIVGVGESGSQIYFPRADLVGGGGGGGSILNSLR